MGFRIQRDPEAFSLSTGRKRPRREDKDYLAQLRTLGCVICGKRPVEAAHIRAPSMLHGKRETGKSERPSDNWCLPLCPEHHRQQHAGNELLFWRTWDINPFDLACRLWAKRDDEEAMEVIVRLARKVTP